MDETEDRVSRHVGDSRNVVAVIVAAAGTGFLKPGLLAAIMSRPAGRSGRDATRDERVVARGGHKFRRVGNLVVARVTAIGA